MPSPVGHMLAGLTTAWVAQSIPGPSRAWRLASRALPAGCAVLAILPDADIVLETHRTFSHSMGAVAAVLVGAACLAWWRRWPVKVVAVTAGVAIGTHLVLDWLGHDTRPPMGIMALWPLSHAYFISGVDLFADISRRYWLPGEFLGKNAINIAREIAILAPVAAAAWVARARARRG